MDNQKHTTGPWHYFVPKMDNGFFIASGMQIIAHVESTTAEDEDKPNAELIARAPELLQENEHLKKSIAYWEKLAQTGASMIDEIKDIEIVELKKRIKELESENGSFVGLISTLEDQIKKLEGLLKRAEPYLARMETIDLNTEIKAALNL